MSPELALIGPTVQIDLEHRISSNYACENWCDSNYHSSYLTPANSQLEAGQTTTFQVFQQDYDHYGITTSYSYDDMSRLTRIKDANPTTTLLDRQYGYNTASQIETITYPTRTRTYSYDNVDRLTGVTDSLLGSLENYGYDEVGNRTSSHLSSTYLYDTFNRLTATDSVTYTYDNNGRMTSRTHGGGLFRAPVPPPPGNESKTYYFNYDNDGRLTGTDRATETEYGIELASGEYRYDALGRRIYENNPDVSITQYTYDGDDVIASSDFGGSNLATRQNGPGIDNKLSVKPAGSSSSTYYHLEHLATTTGTSTAAGALSTSGAPDSFGNGSNDFTGREYDSFNELYYYRARMYDPQLGRFTSEDPIGFAGGDVNLYGYVTNNSVNRVDPLGLFDEAGWLAARAAAAAGGTGAGGAVVAGAGAYIAVGAGGLALGAGIGYYPGQWTANSPYNPFVYGPWNPFGTPYNPFAEPMPQPQASGSKPEAACQPTTNPQPFYRVPPYSSPFAEPEDDRDRDICGKVLSLCLRNPRQPKWNQRQYGKRKDVARAIENVVSTVEHGRSRNVLFRNFSCYEKK